MERRFVPTVATILAFVASACLAGGRAEAQVAAGAVPGTGILSDPFSFYYAVYLPNQQLQAMRPTPLDSVNDAQMYRQYYTQTNRRALYDPVSPYAESYDPLRPYSSQQERLAVPHRFAHQTSNNAGTGPALYFNRVHQYYPDLSGRTTRQKNANVSARRAGGYRGGAMGGGGMGGMGGGGMGGMGGMGMF
jgi:hypothetical protein